MWMYFFHFFSFSFTEHLVCTRFTVYTPVRKYGQETGKRVQRLLPAGIHAMRWWRESPVGWKVSPWTELLESGSRWGSHEEKPGRLLRTSYFFSISAALKRGRAGCMASARGAVQGEEEAGERPRLRVWEEGDPRGPRGCREPLWEWGLGSQSDPVCSPRPLTLLTSFLSGLSTRGLVMGPYESFLEPHSHLDEQSQAKRPPRRTVSARSHRRSQLSSDAPSGTPARLLRASCARLRDFRSPPRGEAGEGLIGAPRGAWKSGKPSHLLSESRN